MNKQTITLSGVALILATLYIVFFTDFFKHKVIQVSMRVSPASHTLVVYLDQAYSLTSIEMVSTEDVKTNKFPHALWHIVANSHIAPISSFNYGGQIAGMAPEVATALPE